MPRLTRRSIGPLVGLFLTGGLIVGFATSGPSQAAPTVHRPKADVMQPGEQRQVETQSQTVVTDNQSTHAEVHTSVRSNGHPVTHPVVTTTSKSQPPAIKVSSDQSYPTGETKNCQNGNQQLPDGNGGMTCDSQNRDNE